MPGRRNKQGLRFSNRHPNNNNNNNNKKEKVTKMNCLACKTIMSM
jgi:hypothetical protein